MKEDATPEPAIGAARDPAFLRAARPILELYTRYFRSEVRGWDHVPDAGPFLVVGNHSGGQAPPDIPVLLTAWWRERGDEEPIYALFHSFFLALPGMGSVMAKAGAIEAGNEAAEAILEGGNILIVYPGGDHECFRPWSERNRIDFGGRRGLVRLALRQQVPVVPAVSIGAHETLVVLTRGEAVARFLRLDRLLRVKVWPVSLGPPFVWCPAACRPSRCRRRSSPSCSSPSTGRALRARGRRRRGRRDRLLRRAGRRDAGRPRPPGRRPPLPRPRLLALTRSPAARPASSPVAHLPAGCIW